MKKQWMVVVAMFVTSLGAVRAAADDKTDVGNTAKAWATAVMAGDAAGVKSHSTGTEAQIAHWEAMSKMIGAFQKLGDAAKAKYGEEGAAMSRMMRKPDFSQFEDQANIEVNGNEATITGHAKDQSKMHLKKDGGEWKVDLASMNDVAKMDDKRLAGMSEAASTTASEITDGKYATYRDAMIAFGRKMAALNGGRPGARPGAPR
jgi:hypothetical protein